MASHVPKPRRGSFSRHPQAWPIPPVPCAGLPQPSCWARGTAQHRMGFWALAWPAERRPRPLPATRSAPALRPPPHAGSPAGSVCWPTGRSHSSAPGSFSRATGKIKRQPPPWRGQPPFSLHSSVIAMQPQPGHPKFSKKEALELTLFLLTIQDQIKTKTKQVDFM